MRGSRASPLACCVLGADADARQDPVPVGLVQLEFDILAAAPCGQPVAERFLTLGRELIGGNRSGGVPLEHLDDVETIDPVDDVAELTRLKREGGRLERRVHHAARKPAQIAAFVF